MKNTNNKNIVTKTYEDLRDYMDKNSLSAIAVLEDDNDGEYVVNDHNYSLNIITKENLR